jgi:gas vesicle protein
MTITKQVTTILLMSNMSICSIDETIEDSTEEASNTVQDFLDRIDAGMDTVTDESDAWRETIEELVSDIPDEIQSTVRNEIQNLANRTIAHAGMEGRCEIDFLGRRALQTLEAIKALVLGQEPAPFEPLICHVVPETLDLNLDPEQRTSISFYGFDLDELTEEGDELTVGIDFDGFALMSWVLDEEAEATNRLSLQTPYNAVLNVAESNGYLPSVPVTALRLEWGEEVISEVPVIAEIVEPEPEPEPVHVATEVRLHGTVEVFDHDDFSYSEFGTFSFDKTITVGDPDAGYSQNVQLIEPHGTMCVDDEVRAEFDLDVDFHITDGSVTVDMPIRLYEGDECSTNDLDGSDVLSVEVAAGQSTHRTRKVRNTAEGDDWVEVNLTIDTELIEE